MLNCPKYVPLIIMLLFLVGCGDSPTGENSGVPGSVEQSAESTRAGESGDVVITNPADLDKHVGETVVIRGELKRLKLASVLGVDLSFNDIESDDMFGKQVECTGKLQREVVTNAPPQAARGDGIYYALIDVSEDEPVTVTVIH